MWFVVTAVCESADSYTLVVVVLLRDKRPLLIPKACSITSVGTYARGFPIIWNEVGGLIKFPRLMYKQFSFLNGELSAAGRQPSPAVVRLISFAVWCPVPLWHGTECSCEGAVIGRYAEIDGRSTARNLTLTRNWEQLCRNRHRSLCSNWCRPLYGVQSHLDTELSATVKGPSSVVMQQCSYECACRFFQRVPCSARHSVARFKISQVIVSVAWWTKFLVTTHITEIHTLMSFFLTANRSDASSFCNSLPSWDWCN